MGRAIGRQPPAGLFELAFAPDLVATPGLVPRDGDVHQALKEVAFGLLGRAPRVLELFVGGEELAGPDQREPARKGLSGRP
jgi:hypothetical protein